MKIITIILIAISLSMDAFSLALIYGTQGIPKKHKLLLATIVGLYHLIMPLIGLTIGKYIENRIIFRDYNKLNVNNDFSYYQSDWANLNKYSP